MNKEKRIFLTIIIIDGIIFTAFVFQSVITETLLPLINKNDYRGFILNLIGFLIIYTGTLIIVYGGFLFVKNTYILFQQEDFNARYEMLREKSISKEKKKQIRKENTKCLFLAWKDGSRWLAIGFFLFIIGSIIINL